MGGSPIEAALFRMMQLPGLSVLYPKPPAEAVSALSELVSKQPADAELYALRARAEEQALDFTAAERDWKAAAVHAKDVPAAQLQLADFYKRRLNPQAEIAALLQAASAPSSPSERFVSAEKQRSWSCFERVLGIAADQALPPEVTASTYAAWIARYPAEPSLRAAEINFLLDQKRYNEAEKEILAYKKNFSRDIVFPVKAAALLAYRRGTIDKAIAIYEQAYQPLWPPELIESYYNLLVQTHRQRRAFAAAEVQFERDPNDYASAAKAFQIYEMEGRGEGALRALARYRAAKESRKLACTPDELYTFAMLLDRAGLYPDAARYYFALADSNGKLTLTSEPAQQAGMAGIIRILLASPEQPLDLGSGNLAIYQDIATLDQGPGYLNGVLSLWMNSEDPAAEFHDEELRATPYFHRAKAAELLAMLDKWFPGAVEAPGLHAGLIQSYVSYGDDAAVVKEGASFLERFAHAGERVNVALTMADVYARTGNTAAEFALYERLLAELGTHSDGIPLTAASASPPAVSAPPAKPVGEDAQDSDGENGDEASQKKPASAPIVLTLPVGAANPVDNSDAVAYREILERYLGRLTMTKRLPEALAVLRRQLDRNPDDPLLYSRLADFLEQNDMSTQQEEVYTRAIARFNQPGFYDKLARSYLRQKRRQDFAALTRKVVDTFSGTELEGYFASVNRGGGWGDLYVQLNLYAHQRFPHDLTFTQNLLGAYQSKRTRNDAAWEELIRQHWSESDSLRNQFFDYLSRTGRLDAELDALERLVPDEAAARQDPAAARELAEVHLWNSHFEAGAPVLASLAAAYPADEAIGDEASSVFRSLAYYDPPRIAEAVAIEKNLLAAEPESTDRLARIGDIYADSTSTNLNNDPKEQLAQAAPFWRRIPAVHPGTPDGFLQSATIFWDYFQFDSALAQIEAARRQFHQPALYGYEAGAIYENKRDPAHAVAEYVAAACSEATGASAARLRLVLLAGRPAYAALVDEASAKAAAERPSIAALDLRVAVLESRRQASSIAGLIDSAVDAAATPAAAADLAAFAQQHNLSASYRHGIERELALMHSPEADEIDRIQLQYALVASLEQGNRPDEIAQAKKIIDSVDQENPKLLGVVRNTVDFDWNHHEQSAAIAVLTQAARDANPTLASSFTEEAATKSNASGQYAQARALMGPLLERDPYNAKFIAIVADSYALANDQAGLRDFYLAKLDTLKASGLSAVTRRDDMALLRQGLIVALTRLKDYAGAVDQHLALISAFPEDENLLQAAGLYALRYGRQTQLVGFLNKTVTDSPLDSRFAIALAKTDALFEDDDGAIAAYSKAIAIRKDRADLYIARADLEERMQAFDAACTDYDRLFLLTYKDPQWMEKAALARARQGRNDLAVKALQSAWIDGRPPSAANEFRIAGQLEKWNILDPARSFAERGIKLAGDDLLPRYASDGAALYARILTRQRHAADAVNFLEASLAAATVSPSSPAVVVQQVERQGIASVTDAEWRRHFAARRKKDAQEGFQLSLEETGKTVAAFYTPEQKLAYAEVLDSHRNDKPLEEVAATWIPAAQAADLKDREAAWRRDVLLHGDRDLAAAQLQPFNSLEERRMEFAALGQTLEEYAIRVKPEQRAQVLLMAEQAWRNGGNHSAELRVLKMLRTLNEAPQTDDRYFALLLRSNPDLLVAENTDASANFILARADGSDAARQLAFRAVKMRAKQRSPVWGSAATALTGLFFADTSPHIDVAFQAALGDPTVADRLKRPDKNKEIFGASWFYYGMRYGVFRTIERSSTASDPEDYLAAGLEAAPAASASYVTLARAYADAGKTDAALAEYDHALELTTDMASIHIAKAELLWGAGRKPQARSEWKLALGNLRILVDVRAVPESFWNDFAAICGDLRARSLGVEFRPELEMVLKPYLIKNGEYRSAELLHSAVIAESKPVPEDSIEESEVLTADDATAEWIVGLAELSPARGLILGELTNSNTSWFPEDQLRMVYARRLQLAEAAALGSAARSSGASPGASETTFDEGGYELRGIRSEYLRYLINLRQLDAAEKLYDTIPRNERDLPNLQRLYIRLRVYQSRVLELVASFSAEESDTPSLDTVASAANELRREKGTAAEVAQNKDAARTLREYVFQQKQSLNQLAVPDYLALAQSRHESPAVQPDVPGALEVLRRMTMLPGDLYVNIDSAADLLERSGHTVEALPYLGVLAASNPWQAGYRLRLAKAEVATGQDVEAAKAALTALAENGDVDYEERTEAAISLRGVPGKRELGSGELTQLAAQSATAAQADRPYFVRAREFAASTAPPAAKAAMLRAAIAFDTSDTLQLALFRAEFAAGANEAALAAAEPLLRPTGYASRTYAGRNSATYSAFDAGLQNDGDDLDDDAASEAGSATSPMPLVLTTSKDKFTFALELATLHERLAQEALGQESEALAWLAAVAGFAPDVSQRAEIAKRLEAARNAVFADAENDARRPVIQESLDQAALVRPRITTGLPRRQP